MFRLKTIKSVTILLAAMVLSDLSAVSSAAAQSPTAAELAARPGLQGVSTEDVQFMADLYDAAVKSGKTTVTFYSANVHVDPNTFLGPVLREFERNFPGIVVQGTRISGAEAVTKVEAEFASGNRQADLIGSPAEYIRLGYLEPFVPPTARDVASEFQEPNGYFTVSSRKLFGLAYNTDLVKPEELPKTIDDLLAPKWKGLVSIAQPSGLTTIDEAIAILFENQAITVDTLKKVADFIPPKDRQVRASDSVNNLAQGRYAFALWAPNQVALELADRGAPVAVARIREGTLNNSSQGLLRDAPAPDAAKLLLTWLFTPAAQTLTAQKVREYATIPGIAPPPGLPDLSDYNYVGLPAVDAKDIIRKYFTEEVKPIFGAGN